MFLSVFYFTSCDVGAVGCCAICFVSCCLFLVDLCGNLFSPKQMLGRLLHEFGQHDGSHSAAAASLEMAGTPHLPGQAIASDELADALQVSEWMASEEVLLQAVMLLSLEDSGGSNVCLANGSSRGNNSSASTGSSGSSDTKPNPDHIQQPGHSQTSSQPGPLTGELPADLMAEGDPVWALWRGHGHDVTIESKREQQETTIETTNNNPF